MKALLKRFLDREISRRSFASGLMALGFSGSAAQSILSSAAQAQPELTQEGVDFVGRGSEILVETLKSADIRYVFNTTATGMTTFFDALATRPEMNLIVALQEGQAASMAHGYELASGTPAALFIPGVAVPNAMNNLYNAWKDRSAIVVLSDGPNNQLNGRDTFQRVDDWLEPMEQFTKWAWQVDVPGQIGEMVRRAIKLCSTPPGGPVHIRIPQNVLATENVKQTLYPQSRFTVPMEIRPKQDLIEEAAQMLVEAENPLISVGSEVTRAGAGEALVELAETLSIPVAQGFSVYGDFPFKHPLFAGFSALGPLRGMTKTDVFLNLGAHMPDKGYFTNTVPRKAKIIQARIEHDAIANTYPTDVAIAAGLKETITHLTEAIKSRLTKTQVEAIRAPRWEAAQTAFTQAEQQRKKEAQGRWNNTPLSWERLSVELDQGLEENAVIVTELDFRTPYYWMDFGPGKKRLIGQTTGFALGWGVGAAIGAKIAKPDEQVVCVVGDGAMLFGQLESLWTASRYDVPVIIVIFNNRSYDGERTRIHRASPLARGENKDLWKDMACYLGDPIVDFVGIAKSFNIEGAQAQNADELAQAVARATEVTRDGRPFVIDALVEQLGFGAGSTWHPDISIAARRTRKV